MRRADIMVAATATLLAAAGPGQAHASPEEELVRGTCTLCHTTAALYTTDSTRLKDVIARMTAKNPEWFKDVDSRHLLEALEIMLADPQMAQVRAAWEAAVARGKDVFSDSSLGTVGKSCADCHTAESLGRVKDGYPKLNPATGRLESLEERLDAMVRTKLRGAGLPLGDERLTSLAIYLRSLR